MGNNQPYYSFEDFLKDEEEKKQIALGLLLRANDKISEARILLSRAIEDGLLDKDNLNVSLGSLLLEHSGSAIRDEIAEMWKNKPIKREEEKIENFVLGHP